MSESELKMALQQEGAERIRGFWQEAEATVSAQRQEIDAELARLHSETDRRIQAESAMLRNTLLFAAQGRAQETRLHAEAALEQRLLLLARQLLPELAGGKQIRPESALEVSAGIVPTTYYCTPELRGCQEECEIRE